MLRIYILVVLVLLGGCQTSPQSMGIDELSWNSMTDAQRQKAREHYQAIRHYVKASHAEDKADRVRVTFSDGRVFMLNDQTYKRFQPVKLQLAMGECRGADLTSRDGRQQVPLFVCYQDDGLYLDPGINSDQDKPGTAYIPRSPMWQWGQRYRNITTGGFAKLWKAELTVRSLGQTNVIPEPEVLKVNHDHS